MLKLLLGSAAVMTVLVLAQPARSGIIADLGINPRSDNGDFSNSPGGGAFEDQYTFLLVGALPQHITIANVTNVFPGPTDFITGFTAAVWTTGLNGIVNDADDVPVIGPVAATQGCGPIANCQFAAGTAILNNGSYYLEFQGIGSGTSGYGGNLSTFAVPGPLAGGIPAILAFGSLLCWRRQRRS